MNAPSSDPVPFAHGDLAAYDRDLNRGLALSGEGKAYFAQGRLKCLARRLDAFRPRWILDYGCGGGDTTLLLAGRWPQARVVGIDTSESLLAAARSAGSACEFHTPDKVPSDLRFDLVYCNGVFHHIPASERLEALTWIRERMPPAGYFALWENNAWHPGARWVMRRIPFDRDAVPLSPTAAIRLVRRAGFVVQACDFAFVFPRIMRWARPVERWASKLPFGAQYQVLCRTGAAVC